MISIWYHIVDLMRLVNTPITDQFKVDKLKFREILESEFSISVEDALYNLKKQISSPEI